jgi:hypothetical protein
VGAPAAGRAAALLSMTLPAAPARALLTKTLRDIGSTPTTAPVRGRHMTGIAVADIPAALPPAIE